MGSGTDWVSESEDLLTSIALELRLPLLQIKTAIETDKQTKELHDQILQSTDSGLRVLEAFVLSSTLYHGRQIPLEPMSIGVILEETAHQLDIFAKTHDVVLAVEMSKNIPPILTYRKGVVSAFTCLTQSVIRSQPGSNLILSASTNSGRIQAGIYGIADRSFNKKSLELARKLTGRANQPLPTLSSNSVSGIMVADRLLAIIADPLKISSKHFSKGLCTTFPISQQLSLV